MYIRTSELCIALHDERARARAVGGDLLCVTAFARYTLLYETGASATLVYVLRRSASLPLTDVHALRCGWAEYNSVQKIIYTNKIKQTELLCF